MGLDPCHWAHYHLPTIKLHLLASLSWYSLHTCLQLLCAYPLQSTGASVGVLLVLDRCAVCMVLLLIHDEPPKNLSSCNCGNVYMEIEELVSEDRKRKENGVWYR